MRLREDEDGFALEHVLVTPEPPEALPVPELAERVNAVLAAQYAQLRDVQLLVNPNGPLSDAGSQKYDGQTGRKLVMDYYGPRVQHVGGSICGTHPTHVDRFGAWVARDLAIDAAT